MPWKVEKQGEKFCVVDKDGKNVKCHPDKAAADKQRAALYANAGDEAKKELEALMLEGKGPTILGVALTNRPHLPLPPIGLVEIDGTEYIRVPFLRGGAYRHPKGDLMFNDKVFSKMLSNHQAGVAHHGVSVDIRHKPELGALAWFDKDKGGRIAQETDEKYGNLLVGYGKPVTQAAKDIIANKQYVYASVEFHTNFPVVEKMLSDDLEEFTIKEGTMPGKDDPTTVTLSAEQAKEWEASQETIKKIQADLKTATERLDKDAKAAKKAEDASTAKVKQLEADLKVATKDDDPPKDDLPEAARAQIDAAAESVKLANERIVQLERANVRADVEAVVAKATSYRDDNGNAHSPVLVNTVQALMLGETIGEEDKAFKLESEKIGDVALYYRKGLKWLLENIPGQVPMATRGESFESRPGDNDADEPKLSKEEAQNFWQGSLFGD